MNRDNLRIYRRRFIPNEMICLDSDEILHLDDEKLITRWSAIHARSDFAGGVSAYFFKEGWKVSKIYDHNGNVLHWYCDIVEYLFDENANSITCQDLLFDVVVSDNGRYKVLDCDEAAEAYESGLITGAQLCSALRSLHELMEVIYHDRFDRLQAIISEYETSDTL